ncbi:cytochrome C biogenesis protein [Lottiidibacillus patelloidae]|uniref:Cytochrome C biogenesis protein n=1 Tax=Lottiidibacillus patelloidae TaxID=2670334 RepID=A0A263BV00_9BACI|nr:cytochrome c biogenesis protein ResB [Lottiidibacillus patelloidae]OZM57157.1 cytochrome C biogenesis protein [Lottiidibacillus patelloidae]
MSNHVCKCGATIKYGAIICEKCGRQLDQNTDDKSLINMRYEGSSRRSQTYKKTIVDKVWNFFSSVKVGVWLIAIAIIGAAIGSIFPQETFIPQNVDPAEYYKKEYGYAGKLYVDLGFNNLYKSWWFTLTLGLIGTSIIIASLDRFIPLYRALKNQGVERHDSFLKRQRLYSRTEKQLDQNTMDMLEKKLKDSRYNVRQEGNSILAEKGRFSRWGPYVNHIGLILILFGGMLRFLPGMYVDQFIWVREGETVAIKGTNNEYYLKNDKFIFEVYDENDEKYKEAIIRAGVGLVPKNYQTNAILYKQVGDKLPGEDPTLEEVDRFEIQVNKPMKFDSFALYQMNFKQNEFKSLTFQLEERDSGKSYGSFTIDLFEPQAHFNLEENRSVTIKEYYPDYTLNDKNLPSTKTGIPNNPGFIFSMNEPDEEKAELLALGIINDKLIIPPPFEGFFNDNELTLRLTDYELRNVTGLTVRKDHTLWIIALGGFIFMVGVIQGMYWQHRRVWVKRNDNEWLIAAHTNKNYFGLQRELETILAETKLHLPDDQYNSKAT